MFKFLKEISAPSIFTKGVLKYKQQKYEDSRELVLKTGAWMPGLKNDDFYNALLLLIEFKLGSKIDIHSSKETLEALAESPYKGTNDFSIIVADLEQLINEHDT
jgi:hypothetical protein